MKWKIKFYKTKDGKCPVKEFIDTQPGKIAQKITWDLRLIETRENAQSLYSMIITACNLH